jgi:hypothetical protein
MTARFERVQTNCKIIWGDKDYVFEMEGDHDNNFQVLVREDCGTYFRDPLTCTPLYVGQETAWKELDRVLSLGAENILMKRREAVAAAGKVCVEGKRERGVTELN